MENNMNQIEKEIDELLSKKTDLDVNERQKIIKVSKGIENGLNKLKDYLASNEVDRNSIIDFVLELENPGVLKYRTIIK